MALFRTFEVLVCSLGLLFVYFGHAIFLLELTHDCGDAVEDCSTFRIYFYSLTVATIALSTLFYIMFYHVLINGKRQLVVQNLPIKGKQQL